LNAICFLARRGPAAKSGHQEKIYGQEARNFTMPPVVGGAAAPINDIQNKKEKPE
jgi:hypothetical protein